MTSDKVMQALLREYPDGLSFAPMALRLLRQKVPLKDSQIEGLKAHMFQLGDDGQWFSRDMISDKKSQLAMRRLATAWLTEQGCFSAERLFEGFCGDLRHVTTPGGFADFLRHLGFTVAEWRRSCFFCFQPPPSLEERLARTSKTIAELLEEADGMLALNEIEEAMPHLTAEALEGIRVQFMPEVHRLEVGGMPCWRHAEAILLPDDFAEKLTTAVDTLVALGEKVSAAKLEFALNLSYCIPFRKVYALPENSAFMRVCAKHYQGGNDAFSNMKTPRAKADGVSVPAKRVRSPNTRFRYLGVPIGAELAFTKDRHITCTVLDDSNQVQYEGRTWAISALATHLLDVSPANGFSYFCYEGETLWERRLRLEREGAEDSKPVHEMPLRDLGVPIGAELVYTKDSHITCTVLDDSNQVQYEGKTWGLSALARHLLDISTAKRHLADMSVGNGFRHFRYEGEILWKRRLRLGREGAQDSNLVKEMPPPAATRKMDRKIVGLAGQPLLPASWRAFKRAGTNPRIAEWARRVEEGETVEEIARESGYAVSTIKLQIGDRHRYFKVCDINGIVPEDGLNV